MLLYYARLNNAKLEGKHSSRHVECLTSLADDVWFERWEHDRLDLMRP